MTSHDVEQLPILDIEQYSDSTLEYIRTRIVELVFTSQDMKPFAEDCNYFFKPFKWNEDRRALLMSELDAIYAHLYAISRIDLTYILDQFPVLAKNEKRQLGEYRTKRLVLEAYDKLNLEMEEMMNE